MTPVPSIALDTDIDMMFNELVARDVDKPRHDDASSQMPTPPHTPLTPPPMTLSTRSCSASEPTKSPKSPPAEDIQPGTPADNTLVSIATSFHPSAGHCDSSPPDLVLLSSDSVFFYVHKAIITPSTKNDFGGFMLRTDRSSVDGGAVELVMLPDSSPVLNIILHILYNISPTHHSPPFTAIADAVERLHNVYGVDVRSMLQNSALGLTVVPTHISTYAPRRKLQESPLFSLIASHAPIYPVEVYALASVLDFLPLARVASTYLHSLDICPPDDQRAIDKLRLSPELAEKIGGLYLSKLVGLHRRRLDVLRVLVCTPPEPHMHVSTCQTDTQSALRRAWALAAAYVIYTAGPDFSAHSIDSTFRPLSQHLSCFLCRKSLEDRIDAVKSEWGSAPRTI